MVFDGLLTTHSSISHSVTSVEKIYFNQALKLLPTHVLSKIITEGWKIVIFSDVNELIAIDSQLTVYTTGVTEYEMRRVFVKGVVDGRNEIAFKTTLLHELTHVFDCIIEGSYCNWKSEKYYNSELENLITQEGSNFSDYAQSDVKEYLCTVVAKYLLNLTDFNNVPLTKAFIEKYYYMCEDSIEQRLRNLENNAVTYIELDETYNKLKYSKLNKENDKYVLQLPTSSGGGSSSGGSTDSNVIYDNNVKFSTSVSYFSLNKTTISYINETLDSNTVGTWELKTIMGSTSAIAIQIRTFILNGRDSAVTDFTKLPNVQLRYFDYNGSRSWSSWVDKISTLENRVKALENNSGSTGGSGEVDGYGEKLIAHYIHQGNQEIRFSSFDFTTCEGTTTVAHGLTGAKEIIIAPNNWTLENRNNNVMSIPIEWIQSDTLLKVVPVDDITLRVTKTDGTTIIPVNLSDSVNSNVNIENFHFEIPMAWSISNIPISSKYCRIITKGYIKSKTNRYLTWKTSNESGTEVSQQYLNLSHLPAIVSPNPLHGVFLTQNYLLDFRDGIVTFIYDNYAEGRKGGNNNLSWVWMGAREQGIKIFNNAQTDATKICYLGSQNSGVAFNANGTHVYIYSLGGN